MKPTNRKLLQSSAKRRENLNRIAVANGKRY
jgi:hypothetical protein